MEEKNLDTQANKIEETPKKKRKKHRKRWWLLPLLFIFPLLWWWGNRQNKGSILDRPSDKALAKLTPAETQPGILESKGGRIQTKCFSLQLPDVVFNPHVEENEKSCVVRASLLQPRGLVTISLEQKTAVPSFSEHTGLQLRQKEPERYTPAPVDFEISFPAKAFKTTNELTIFIDRPEGVFIVSAHSLVTFDEGIEPLLDILIRSTTFEEN